MKKDYLILLACLLLLGIEQVNACTSAIISGKVTPDGRPIMWKNRDTSDFSNCVRYMKGEKYNFIAVTGYAANPRSVWMGTNESGFSIMNTVSYNLIEKKEGEKTGSRNGSLMKRALEICATVDDFKNYLDTLKRPLLVETNYGVIDAQGNGAYFEVDYTQYTEYNVNNPIVAPHGYIVRANFSVSGKFNDGAGYVRYQEAEQKLFNASASGEVTPAWLFSNLSRSFNNPLMGIDLKSGQYNKPYTNGWFVEQDFIARKKSTCAVAIQGVKSGEDPSFTTMWTIIGYPPVTPAIPIWVKGAEKKLPKLLTLEKETRSCPLCDATCKLRDKVYSYKQGSNAETYFNWELLFNSQQTGYLQLNETIEKELLLNITPKIESWRKNSSLPTTEVYQLYDDADRFITQRFEELFQMKL